MKMKVLVFEPKKCIGCRLCEQICTMSHFEVTNPEKALIRVIRDHNKQLDLAIYCHSCSNAPCITACKFEALSKNHKTNAIEVNKDNCVGCRSCIEQCPFAVPAMHPDEDYILICDLCGGDPECVKICPEQAIQYLNVEQADNITKSQFVNEMGNKLSQEED